MGMAELIVEAVLTEGRSKSAVAADYAVSRRWVITLVQRYLAEGPDGLRPRSRRPLRSPTQTPRQVENEIVRLRKDLDKAGTRQVPTPSAACCCAGTAPPRRRACQNFCVRA